MVHHVTLFGKIARKVQKLVLIGAVAALSLVGWILAREAVHGAEELLSPPLSDQGTRSGFVSGHMHLWDLVLTYPLQMEAN